MAQQLQRHQAFLRLGKITKGPESALIAARHNLRELPLALNMVAGKQSLNYVLQGPKTAAAVQANYEAVLTKQGISKLRKDAVRLIEALVSLPVGVNDSQHQYFQAALQWLAAEFGKANILSAVIHKDEAAQHMHVLIIPLIDGRMRGADLMGGPGVMRDRHARFVASMQQPWVQLGVFAQPPLRVRKAAMTEEVLAYLRRSDDPMWKSCVAQVIRDCIESNPEPFYLTLGLSQKGTACSVRGSRHPRVAKQRTMAQIFTRPIKGMRGVKAERYRQSEEYQRAHVVAPKRRCAVMVNLPQAVEQVQSAPVQHQSQISNVNAVQKLQTPPAPMRTLCSVGFAPVTRETPVTVGPVKWIAEAMQAEFLEKPAALCPAVGCWFPRLPFQQKEGFSELKWLSLAVPLNGLLLRWWLYKARLP